MRISSSCQHCLKALQRGSRTLFSKVGSSTAITAHLNSSSPAATKTTSPLLITKRHFTLPDLSNFSPFSSSSNSPNDRKDEGSDFNTYYESVVMPFNKDSLFEIVSNVAEYDKFVPYCIGSKIDSTSTKQVNQNTKEFLADLTIGYGQVRESYTSKVSIVAGKSVHAIAIPTPLFKKLETKWTFEDDAKSDSTRVDFQVYYSFSNPLYAVFASKAIEKMTTKMIDSFTQRARQIEQSQSHKHQ